jgi:hypothetical protein
MLVIAIVTAICLVSMIGYILYLAPGPKDNV